MKHGQYFVRCKIRERWYNVDILDLEEDSFRAVILERLSIGRLLVGIREEYVDGEAIEAKVKPELENKYITTEDEKIRNSRSH